MDREALGGLVCLFLLVDLLALVNLQNHVHPAEQHKQLSNTLTVGTG